MKNLIYIFSFVFFLTFATSVKSQGFFSSDSPFEETNQEEEQMDRNSMKSAIETKKANNRGGSGGSGGFATFNTNTQDVPIDSGILIFSIGLIAFGVFQIAKNQHLKKRQFVNVA